MFVDVLAHERPTAGGDLEFGEAGVLDVDIPQFVEGTVLRGQDRDSHDRIVASPPTPGRRPETMPRSFASARAPVRAFPRPRIRPGQAVLSRPESDRGHPRRSRRAAGLPRFRGRSPAAGHRFRRTGSGGRRRTARWHCSAAGDWRRCVRRAAASARTLPPMRSLAARPGPLKPIHAGLDSARRDSTSSRRAARHRHAPG